MIEVTGRGRGCVTGGGSQPNTQEEPFHTPRSFLLRGQFPKPLQALSFFPFATQGRQSLSQPLKSSISIVGGWLGRVSSVRLLLVTLAWSWPSLGLRIFTQETKEVNSMSHLDPALANSHKQCVLGVRSPAPASGWSRGSLCEPLHSGSQERLMPTRATSRFLEAHSRPQIC